MPKFKSLRKKLRKQDSGRSVFTADSSVTFQSRKPAAHDSSTHPPFASAVASFHKFSKQIEAENEALTEKVNKLEAQVIIGTAANLDLLAQTIGIVFSLGFLVLYIKIMFWLWNALIYSYWNNVNADIGEDQVHAEVITEQVVTNFNYYYNLHHAATNVIDDASYPTSTDGNSEMSNQIMTYALCFSQYVPWCLLGKFIIVGYPFLQHHLFYGRTNRRFHVFAVAFVFMMQIKFTRHNAKLFIADDKSKEEEDGKGEQSKNDDGTARGKVKNITSTDIWDATNEINARFLYSSVLRLRGLCTKSAQYLSSRADFVPLPFVRELSKLQDSAPETEWKLVEKLLKKSDILQYFKKVEEKPIASASIGQVHVASLKKEFSGEKVVIKVMHPNARTLLLDDFVSMKIISKMVSWMEPEYQFIEVLLREWSVEARKELDFISEASNLFKAKQSIDEMKPLHPSKQLKEYGNHIMTTNPYPNDSPEPIPFQVEIPRPIKELSSNDILVMSFCEGKRIDDLDEIQKCNNASPVAVMDALSQVFAHMMYVTDIFNGDPHPGNIFIRPGIQQDKKVGFTISLLDWGLAKRLPNPKRIGFCQMTYAAATFDFGMMMDGFTSVGLKLKRENVAEDMEGLRFILRDMVPRKKARNRIRSKIRTDIKRSKLKKKGERVPVESKAYPGEFFFFIRTNELLHGLGSKLSVEFSYLNVLKVYAEKGLLLSDKYKSRAKELSVDPITVEPVTNETLNNKIDELLHEMQSEGKISGVQVCVLDSNGDTVAHKVRGHMGSLKKMEPMRSDTLALGFSVTKATAATLVHLMVQLGYLTYDEPICERIWPAFCPTSEAPDEMISSLKNMADRVDAKMKWEWKRSVTLRHILTHTSGMWTALPQKLSIKTLASCEYCCKAFEYDAANPHGIILPSSEPGTQCIYHYLSFGWLVAGVVRGAYIRRHDDAVDITYEEIYNTLLKPRLSVQTRESGFRPCGGSGGHDMAFFDFNDNEVIEKIQVQREAEAMGESIGEARDYGLGEDKEEELRESIREKEFIFDLKIWNSMEGLKANVPAAGGRFSAKGLASFYHDLGTGKILDSGILEKATELAECDHELRPMSMLSPDGSGTQFSFGLGYQTFDGFGDTSGTFWGHPGIGGSIGLFHTESKTSIAIMFNKRSDDADAAKKIVHIIASQLGW